MPMNALMIVQCMAAAGRLAASASSEYQVRNRRSMVIIIVIEPLLRISGTATVINSRRVPGVGAPGAAGGIVGWAASDSTSRTAVDSGRAGWLSLSAVPSAAVVIPAMIRSSRSERLAAIACSAVKQVHRPQPRTSAGCEADTGFQNEVRVQMPERESIANEAAWAVPAILVDGRAVGCRYSLSRAETSPAARCPDSMAPSMYPVH